MARYNFIAAFERAASIKPGKPYLVVGRETLTYGELLDRVARLTALFRENGLKAGDRVIVATTDDIEAVVLHLGLLRNGMATVMLDPRTPAPAARVLIAAADAKGILLDREIRNNWQPVETPYVLEIVKTRGRGATLFNKLLKKKSEDLTPPDSYPAILGDSLPEEGPRDLQVDLDALILFTSGTTSQPKGVRLSQSNITHHLDTLTRQYGYDSSARILNVLPLHHADGMIQGPVIALWNGATVYRPVPFTIQNMGYLVDSIYAERVTHFIAVPTILTLFLKFGNEFKDAFRTEDFRFIVSAAAALEADMWQSFEEFFGTRVANLYGLTETVTGGLFSGPTVRDHCYGTVGKPSDCLPKIINDRGEVAATGEPGELLIRGDNVMQGYLNAPEATAEVLKDGWLHTGDIATCDDAGYYRIVGRKKNVIITGGLNVHPEEVTEVLNVHPGVLESCTFGVEDTTWGERVASAVVLNGQEDVDEPALVEYCRGGLAPAKVPHRIYLVPYLPKGPSGKTIIAKARELALQQSKIHGGEAGGDVKSQVMALAASCFNVPLADLAPSSSPDSTPGWDSLAHLNFVVELEEYFGLRFTPREIISLSTLQDAETIVTERYDG